jgi:hypothetical protein
MGSLNAPARSIAARSRLQCRGKTGKRRPPRRHHRVFLPHDQHRARSRGPATPAPPPGHGLPRTVGRLLRRVPRTPGDGRLDHPLVGLYDPQDAGPGELGGMPAVRRIRTRRRHLLPPGARAAAARRHADRDRYQPALHRLPQGDDQRRPLRAGLPFSTLPDGVGPEIAAATHRVLRPGGAFLVYQFSAKARDFMARHFRRIDQGFELLNVLPVRLFWGWKDTETPS